MTQVAKGEFTLDWAQEPPFDDAPGASMSRVTVTKSWTGDITGSSVAHLLTAMSPVTASAGYVAIERMGVSLAGREGTFVLQHSAISSAERGQQIEITVVPDTGTDGLKAITGRLNVTVEGRENPTEAGGRHLYEFTYDLAD
jgi:hypothetical protein